MGHPAKTFGKTKDLEVDLEWTQKSIIDCSYWPYTYRCMLVIGTILSMAQVLFLGCLCGQCPIIKWRPPWLCSTEKKWWTELPEGFAYPIPPSMGPIFAARGQVILGYLANRFGSRFEWTQNYCGELLALYLHRMII